MRGGGVSPYLSFLTISTIPTANSQKPNDSSPAPPNPPPPPPPDNYVSCLCFKKANTLNVRMVSHSTDFRRSVITKPFSAISMENASKRVCPLSRPISPSPYLSFLTSSTIRTATAQHPPTSPSSPSVPSPPPPPKNQTTPHQHHQIHRRRHHPTTMCPVCVLRRLTH